MMEEESNRSSEPAWLSGRVLASVAIGIGLGALILGGGMWLGKSESPNASPPPADRQIDPHQGGAATPSDSVRTKIADLRTQVSEAPEDPSPRKELAVLMVRNEMFVPAFEEAKALLEIRPNDPDGLYVVGMVRLRMGQNATAIGSLDRVLEAYPAHVLALTARGLAALRFGRTAEAVQFWQRGLVAAGGRHPELERLLAASMSARGSDTAANEGQAPRTLEPALGTPAANGAAGVDPDLINSYLRPARSDS